ncbi:MAG: type II secretion system protein [Verrucomicrobiae bacterium]|nr:type II secretion system protein [Verrucomicrobiae bacterium]
MNLSRNSLERRSSPAPGGDAHACPASPVTRHSSRAFTLIELLVVISILGILAALTVPALKNLGKSNVAVSAARQMLDDVGRARQLAITHRTTVYMVFVSTNYWLSPYLIQPNITNSYSSNEMSVLTGLIDKQLTGYTYISYGALGDQPGSHVWQYLASWQALPDNSFIAGWKFQPSTVPTIVGAGAQRFTVYPFNFSSPTLTTPPGLPFPDAAASMPRPQMPYIAFNYLGQLTDNGVDPATADEYIPLAQGAVGFGYDGATKQPQLSYVPPEAVTEAPSGNSTNSMFTLVHIDALTGRARLEFQKVQ